MVFYAEELKVYGQIPYILQRRLGAKFISNEGSIFGGGRIMAPTGEKNYTIVPYRRPDGRPHTDKALEKFFDWLYEGKGFKWAIAGPQNFYDQLDLINWWNVPPKLLKIALVSDRVDLLKMIQSGLDLGQ